jgi:prolyl oligopeptidase PreP (S9A serine peptidase family)
LLLNGKQITGNDVPGTTLFRSKNIRWSSDSKYISIIAFTDRRIEPVTLTEIHIVNVEKTYNEGKIVIDKTINLRDSYCVFRSGLTAQITTNGKVLLSMSFNQKDVGILYEVDIETGKRTPIIYD